MATPTTPREERHVEVLPALVGDAGFEALRTHLPLTDPDRYALESTAAEDIFRHLAIDHPDAITYDPNWRPGGTS